MSKRLLIMATLLLINALSFTVIVESSKSSALLAVAGASITGDLDGNNVVDIFDIIILVKSYMATSDKPNWNPNADVNKDGIVDMYDALILSNHFGEHIEQSLRIGIYTSSWNFGEYNASTIANTFDMSQSCFVSPTGEPLNDYTQKMNTVKSLNPNYKALMYHNVAGIEGSDPNWQTAKSNGWLLKHTDGSYVTSRVYPSMYIVDTTNPGYQTWVAALIKSQLDTCPYFDGVMADNGMTTSVEGWEDWQTANPPINPKTGAPFNIAEILNGYLGLHTAIRNAIGSKILFVNGIWNGAGFYKDNYVEVVDFLSKSPMNGPMSEGCWYQGSQFMTETDWLKSLNFVVWMQDNWLKNHPERLFVETCGSGLQWTMPPGCTNEQMMLYGYCSALLGIKYTLQNSVDFSFRSNANTAMLQLTQKLHDLDLVSPLGDYYKIFSTSVYARDFAKGKVVVNPTESQYIITLDRSYTTLDGSIISDSLTVGPHSGILLFT